MAPPAPLPETIVLPPDIEETTRALSRALAESDERYALEVGKRMAIIRHGRNLCGW